MLTIDEKREVKRAKYFGIEWGVVGKGLSPEALLATYRGAVFVVEGGVYGPECFLDTQRGITALEDISNWLGFKVTDDYQQTVLEEEEQVFKRATEKKL